MQPFKFILLFCLLYLPFSGKAQNSWKVQSPDHRTQLVVQLLADGSLQYSIQQNNTAVLLPSGFNFVLSKPEVTLQKFALHHVDSLLVNDSWQPVWGEQKTVRNHYQQFSIGLTDLAGSDIQINLVFRVFNDGIGFRYEFPKQNKLHHFVVKAENTQFQLTGNHTAFWIPGDYDSNEFRYNTTKIATQDSYKAAGEESAIGVTTFYHRHAVQTPLMLKSNDGIYLNIHEAALVNYPAMQLIMDTATFLLRSNLVPNALGDAAYLEAPFQTPWRTLIFSNKATDILASNIIINLNEPCKIADPSFIKPQKFMGVWWEMFNGKSSWDTASGHHGATTANVKKYLDFASKHGIDGVLVEGWDRGWEDWYGQWKENVFDFITPYSDYNLPELAAYAKSKNVRIVMHHETSASAVNYERYIDTAYRLMKNYGMNSVKTGYVGKIIPRGEHHDGQWMVNHYAFVLRKAASYGIMVDAHEPVRPTGLHRTYPNLLACEAARGTEFNGFSAGNLPEHETILPFTRLMGGPMDYTPGIFKMKLTQFDPNKKEAVHTTLAKQLAFYVVFFSPIQMAADMPENYEAHLDAFQFIKDVAVDWDEKVVVEAEPGDYITIARKAKNKPNWFIGAVTDENGRTATIPLQFLDKGKKYQAIIYRDGDKAHYDTNPESYIIESKDVTANSTLQVVLAPGGGCAIEIKPR